MSDYYLKVRQVCELTMTPFYLVGGVVVGYWIGGWIDQQFRIAPYFQVSFMVLGLFSGMWESWRVIYRFSESQNDTH